MSICVRRFADLRSVTISTLEHRLFDYYSHPPDSYYTIANQAAANYQPDIQPFHCDLLAHIKPGMTVLELGCGSAHLCPFVERAGASYTGMDHSAELLENNRTRFPDAIFLTVATSLPRQFDVVASLYTIEHIVDPTKYLESMWTFCKPGGLVAVICPDFVEGPDFPPSFYYGKTPRRFRAKIASASFIDACRHLFDLFWSAARWKVSARKAAPGAFWINVKPRVLAGADYSIDADAVHLPRLQDLVWWLEKRGAAIVATSRSLPNIDPAILRYNCYVIAQKPFG